MKVDVARRTRDPLSMQESHEISEIYTFTIENGLIIEGEKDFLLEPYDIVAVRRSQVRSTTPGSHTGRSNISRELLPDN